MENYNKIKRICENYNIDIDKMSNKKENLSIDEVLIKMSEYERGFIKSKNQNVNLNKIRSSIEQILKFKFNLASSFKGDIDKFVLMIKKVNASSPLKISTNKSVYYDFNDKVKGKSHVSRTDVLNETEFYELGRMTWIFLRDIILLDCIKNNKGNLQNILNDFNKMDFLSRNSINLAEVDKNLKSLVREETITNFTTVASGIVEAILHKKISFEIPDYQREFVWDKNRMGELIDDIDKTFETNNKHFIGSISVRLFESNNNLRFRIIDGQQRITASILIMKAFHLLIDNDSPEYKELDDFFNGIPLEKKSKYYSNYWSTKDSEKSTVELKDSINFIIEELKYIFSLKPGKKIIDSKLTKTNYGKMFLYAFDKINQRRNNFIDSRYKSFKSNLNTVFLLFTSHSTDEMELFECMNSKGTSLNNIDLVKNHLLSKVSEDDEVKATEIWHDQVNSAILQISKVIKRGNLTHSHENYTSFMNNDSDKFLITYILSESINLVTKNKVLNSLSTIKKGYIFDMYKLLFSEKYKFKDGRLSIENFERECINLRKAISIFALSTAKSASAKPIYSIELLNKSDDINGQKILMTKTFDWAHLISMNLLGEYGEFSDKNWIIGFGDGNAYQELMKSMITYIMRLRLKIPTGDKPDVKVRTILNGVNSKNANVKEWEKILYLNADKFNNKETTHAKLLETIEQEIIIKILITLLNNHGLTGSPWESKDRNFLEVDYLMPLEYDSWGKKIEEYNPDIIKELRLQHSISNGKIGNVIPLIKKPNKAQKAYSLEKKLSEKDDWISDIIKINIDEINSKWSFNDIDERNSMIAKMLVDKIIY